MNPIISTLKSIFIIIISIYPLLIHAQTLLTYKERVEREGKDISTEKYHMYEDGLLEYFKYSGWVDEITEVKEIMVRTADANSFFFFAKVATRNTSGFFITYDPYNTWAGTVLFVIESYLWPVEYKKYLEEEERKLEEKKMEEEELLNKFGEAYYELVDTLANFKEIILLPIKESYLKKWTDSLESNYQVTYHNRKFRGRALRDVNYFYKTLSYEENNHLFFSKFKENQETAKDAFFYDFVNIEVPRAIAYLDRELQLTFNTLSKEINGRILQPKDKKIKYKIGKFFDLIGQSYLQDAEFERLENLNNDANEEQKQFYDKYLSRDADSNLLVEYDKSLKDEKGKIKHIKELIDIITFWEETILFYFPMTPNDYQPENMSKWN